MVNFDYLQKGLNALARAHHLSSMAGHLGASVIAGYFVGEQNPNLEPEVIKGIENDLEMVIRGKSVFGKNMSKNAKLSDTELFATFPKEKPDPQRINEIAKALQKNINKPRQSGHNVIFASIAIRALNQHPELTTPSVVDGIVKLINMFDTTHPGSGYYGKEKGRLRGNQIKLPENDDTPDYMDLEGMAIAVLDEVIAQETNIHRQGYGGLVHVINHAAAIADLADYGYPDLVPRAVKAHRHHLQLFRNLPNLVDELGPVPESKFTPHSAAYWTSGEIPYDRALLTHRVKTMFGFTELAAAIEDEKKENEAYRKLRYMM